MSNLEHLGSNHFSRVRLDRFSPGGMDSVIDSSKTEHVQLSKGVFEGDLFRAQAGDKVLDSGIYTQAILGRGDLASDRITLGAALPSQRGGILDGCKLDGTTLFVYSEGTELCTRLEPHTTWVTLQVARSELESCGLFLPEYHCGAVSAQPESYKHLFRELDELLSNSSCISDFDRQSYGAQDSLESMLTVFIHALSNPSLPSQTHTSSMRRNLVKGVQEFLHENLEEKILISELCSHWHVSYKTLERAFLDVLGLAPRDYLFITRISRARRMLLDPVLRTRRIIDIAAACGITELGRFSRDYKYWYGESPSRTLASTRSEYRADLN